MFMRGGICYSYKQQTPSRWKMGVVRGVKKVQEFFRGWRLKGYKRKNENFLTRCYRSFRRCFSFKVAILIHLMPLLWPAEGKIGRNTLPGRFLSLCNWLEIGETRG